MSLVQTMTVSEAAQDLGVSHQWVLNRVNRKKIKGEKRGGIWLLRRSSVERAKNLLKKNNPK